MSRIAHCTASFGNLVAAAFDGAATYSSDPDAVSWLATRAIAIMLRRSRAPYRLSRRLPANAAGQVVVVVPV